MNGSKMLLQAGDGTGSPIDIPGRFKLNVSGSSIAVAASSGGVPMPMFLAVAHDLGFVDNFTTSQVPAVGRLGNSYVKSLYVPILELAAGAKAHLTPGVSMEFGNRVLLLDSEIPDINANVPYIVQFVTRISI